MAKSVKNKNCPLKDECGRKCEHLVDFEKCDYYFGNYIPEDMKGRTLPELINSAPETGEYDEYFEEVSDGKKQITYIPIKKLFPHPDNPRKELGDLTELADSIKAKGIMQNLTVVPKDIDTYTVIIGHRRLGASKIAGLLELPCVIADMSPKEQIATMATENMQRSDLTIYEEACCMQMMLDLGDTIENVSEQTGLSQTTVRRRVKLLELDEGSFKRSLERGATLMDYEKLDKIKDAELKNKVLDSIGTKNFEWELKKALDSEKMAEREKKAIEILSKFAKPRENTEDLKYVNSVYLTNNSGVDIPADSDIVQYYYYQSRSWISIYRDKTEKDLLEENKREEEYAKSENIRRLASDIAKRAYELRKEFIKTAYISSKEHTEALLKFAFSSIFLNTTNYKIVSDDMFCDYAGLGTDYTEGTIQNIIDGSFGMKSERALLLMAYANFHDDEHMKYTEYGNKYKINKKLESIYSFLEKLGYECSDEERAWRDGSHEIYTM